MVRQRHAANDAGKGTGGSRSAHAAGLGAGGGAAAAAAVIYILLEFGLIGPGAKSGALEGERRITRVETRVESLEQAVKETRDQLLAELRGLRIDVRRGSP